MIDQKQIKFAKHSDLPSILRNMGIDLIKEGGSCFHLREHDSLKLFSENGIWLYKWWSRNGEVGDSIQFLQRFCSMSFQKAIATLTFSNTIAHQPQVNNNPPLKSQKSTVQWQVKAQKLIEVAQNNLLNRIGKQPLDYLINERGLSVDTIRKQRLGWLPENDNMPSKLLIPCFNTNGKLIRIRFRMDKPQKERYRLMKGSDPNSPFPIGVRCDKPSIIVESELDALLLYQETGDLVGVLGLGTIGVNLSSRVLRFINEKIPASLICMDNDRSGHLKMVSLMKEIRNATNWSVPKNYGKDPGEAWKYLKLKDWVKAGLNENKRLKRR